MYLLELNAALLCLEFGSSRDPAVLDAKFRCIRSIVNQAQGYYALSINVNNLVKLST